MELSLPAIERVRREPAQLTQALLNVCADVLVQPSNTSAVQRICDEMVAQMPEIQLVWTWFGAADTAMIQPQTISGAAGGYARALSFEVCSLHPENPALQALKGRQTGPFKINAAIASTKPWRLAAQTYGIHSILTVPLASHIGAHAGIMVLYATDVDYFERTGMGLFEAVGNITGAILLKQSQAQRLEHLAFYDGLTGQMNRNGLYRALHAQPQSGYCVMLDIDLFKTINDSHGHCAGDVVLARLGHLINSHTLKRRQVDAFQTMQFLSARWGGEEFFIFIGNGNEAQVLAWVEQLRVAIQQLACVISPILTVNITASFGMAFCPDSHAMLRGSIEAADAALYQAKAAGRNCTVVHSHGMSVLKGA
jgi:diguanylate cyclase (GGDEF)-like protein